MDLTPRLNNEELRQQPSEDRVNYRKFLRYVPSWGVVLGVLAVGLLAGWFAGRNSVRITDAPQVVDQPEQIPSIAPPTAKEDYPQDQSLVWLTGVLPRGSSLYNCLVRQGVSPQEIFKLQQALKPLFNLRKCPAGSSYQLALDNQNRIVKFSYRPNAIDLYSIRLSPEGNLEALKEKIQTRVVKIEGEISSSLYQTLLRLGHSAEVVMQLADIFAWQIDFLTEPRPEDQFKLVVEEEYREKAKRPKRILAAQYRGRLTGEHTAIFFCDPSGHCDYYTPEGKSLHKAFLRAPLKYRRISSHFSYRRLHPILRVWRPHLGIDYAAPIGTPVSAIGDGVVTKKGWTRDGGNFLKLRHSNGYTSTYCHLSRFAKRIKQGRKVRQGDVIAYVGSTGMSTGPHLYFAISRNGKEINFLKMKLPSATSVEHRYLSQFSQTKEERLAMLNSPVDSGYVVLQPGEETSAIE